MALKRREINELITEELRRMDADAIFEQATQQLLRRRQDGKTSEKRPKESRKKAGER